MDSRFPDSSWDLMEEVRCECGFPTLRIYETIDGVFTHTGFYCSTHGVLSHDQIIFPKDKQEE